MKRKYSLKRNKEFRYVYKSGKSVPCRNLVLVYKKNRTGLLRVGLTVSKKIGNSVTRNRVKRRLRSALDLYINRIDPDYNIIIIARAPVVGACFGDIVSSLDYALEKAGILCMEQSTDGVDVQ